MPSPSSGWKAGTFGLRNTQASPSWSSIRPPSAATPLSMKDWSSCGRASATRDCWSLAYRQPILGGQEPGNPAEIGHTAHGKYGVTFPLAEKVTVKGASAHPFYKWAAGERPLEVPRWNFHKYLVGRDGHIAAAFSSDIEPSDARIVAAIAKEMRPAAS